MVQQGLALVISACFDATSELLWYPIFMIYEFDSFDAYHAACKADPGLRGISPGGVSPRLGLSRQAIYIAVKRGNLDQVRIMEKGQGPYLIIPESSIQAYLNNHLGRVGRPNLRQRVQHAVDKHVHGVWPNS